MTSSESTRRPGYASDNASVGRRGRHTRERILGHAAALFVSNGYHDTSIDNLAKAVGGSRATIYQYFEDKHEICLELAATCRPVVFEHARSLGRLAPDEAGLRELRHWLSAWADLSDKYALVFLEFPGIGTIENNRASHLSSASHKYTEIISDKLRGAGIAGLSPVDAAAVTLRICHMLNLAQFRRMFELHNPERVTTSLAIAVQRLIFPETPSAVLTALGGAPKPVPASGIGLGASSLVVPDDLDAGSVSPVRQDILSAASLLFTEQGFYSASMEDIATAAEVSRATLYRHFSTKVALLEELSSWSTIESARLSSQLHAIAASQNSESLRAWLSHYVHFHRAYGGVTRAWYDGAIVRQVPGESVAVGMRTLHAAVQIFLTRRPLSPGLEPDVAAAIFLAVLGRLSEYSTKQHPAEKDYDAAGFMLLILRRTLLGDAADQPGRG